MPSRRVRCHLDRCHLDLATELTTGHSHHRRHDQPAHSFPSIDVSARPHQSFVPAKVIFLLRPAAPSELPVATFQSSVLSPTIATLLNEKTDLSNDAIPTEAEPQAHHQSPAVHHTEDTENG